MTFDEFCQFLNALGGSPAIQLVLAIATILAVLVAIRSARLATDANREAVRIGEESVRIGKENTKHNAALLAQAEHHARLSVRPLLMNLGNCDRELKGVVYTFGVENAGVGPAVIRHVKFYFNHKEFTVPDRWCDEPLELAKKCLEGKDLEWTVRIYGNSGTGSAITVGQKKIFLQILFPYFDKAGKKRTDAEIDAILNDVMNAADYEVVYGSIYADDDDAFKPLRTWE